MVALLLAPILTFSYPVGQKFVYDMKVEIDGHLPLLGWRQGKAKLELSFEVEGLRDTTAIKGTAKHRILTFRSELNGAVLPFKLENVRSFFPDTTVTYYNWGQIIDSDAPKKELPSSIPGLDSQRFPEMTYLPLEHPGGDATSWTFTRIMGGDPMTYKVETDRKTDRTWKFDVSQAASFAEDSKNVRLTDLKNAKFEVKTLIAGQGIVHMHSAKWIVSTMKLTAKTQRSESLIGESTSPVQREWTTKVDVALRTR